MQIIIFTIIMYSSFQLLAWLMVAAAMLRFIKTRAFLQPKGPCPTTRQRTVFHSGPLSISLS